MSKITDKQKAARIANLEKGRLKSLEKLKMKKEDKHDPSSEDESSSDSESDEDFVISKKKSKTKQPRGRIVDRSSFASETASKSEVDELKKIMMEMAIIQKQQGKAVRKQRRARSPNVVVVPQYGAGAPPAKSNNHILDALREKLMRN